MPPTYFQFEGKEFTNLGSTDYNGRPIVRVTAFEPKPLPLFLEGAVRYFKTIDIAAKKPLYENIKTSPLHDTEIGMYKISESLAGTSDEIGRVKSFAPGWLENESIWLRKYSVLNFLA